MDELKTCDLCGRGRLHPKVKTEDGLTGLTLHYSVCDVCGSEQADSEQLRLNKLNKLNVRKTL